MIKAIVFDLWETLIPATIDFVHLGSLIKTGGIPLNDFTFRYEKAVQLKKYKNFEELRKDFFKEFNQESNELLEKELYEIFFNRFDKIHFYPEVEKNLVKLKAQGYKLGLLSNTENLHAGDVAKKLKLENYFDAICLSFEIGALKPDKKAFAAVLKKLKVKPSEALMVGNSLRSDVGGAQSSGLHNCWLNRSSNHTGFGKAKPEFEILSLNDIYKVLGALNGSKKASKD